MAANIEHFDLSGKKALVVGAETPAGGAIARAYAEAGADVALAALRADDGVMAVKALQKEIEASGRRSSVYVMDVTLGRNVQVTTRQIAKEMGGLDVVASTPDLFLGKPIEQTTDPDLQQVMTYNFNAHFFVARSAVGELRRGGGGRRWCGRGLALGDGRLHAGRALERFAGLLQLEPADVVRGVERAEGGELRSGAERRGVQQDAALGEQRLGATRR